MKRALLLTLAVAALAMVPAHAAAAGMPEVVHGASSRGVVAETDYDPDERAVVTTPDPVAAPDLHAMLDWLDGDGGFMAGLRYLAFLLFAQ